MLKPNKKIPIYNDSTIFVLSPAYFKTGGTELLHQYVSVLKANGFDARIAYVDSDSKKNINEAFLIYVDSYCTLSDIVDDKKNILVVPEIYTGYLKMFKNIKKVIWWESVDNYLKLVSPFFCAKLKEYGLAMRLFFKKMFGKNSNIPIRKLKDVDYHFVQSYYAFDFLNKKKINNDNVFTVSDYINDIYLKNSIDFCNRENLVLFNPKKGIYFTKKIIKANPKQTFVPLINLSNNEVFSLLNKAKVYIDFGNHPGKDRFPREAAMCGCCVITNKNGSAKFIEDVPILEAYKFDMKNVNIKHIVDCIDECINKYSEKVNDFSSYRAFISNEKESFFNDVLQCFVVK